MSYDSTLFKTGNINRNLKLLKANLKFPEGVATAAVLKTGHESDAKKSSESLKLIGLSALVGGAVKLGELAFGIWSSAIGGAIAIRGAIFGMGASLSPSLISVGYIVGRNIGILAFSGGLISWAVAIPIYSYLYGFEGDSFVHLKTWATRSRMDFRRAASALIWRRGASISETLQGVSGPAY